MNQIITVKIGRRIYEKVCSYINDSLIIFTEPDPTIKYKKVIREKNYTYTQEMQDRAIKIQAAKRLKKQNKTIDFQRFRLKLIMDTHNNIEFIIFICKQLSNYKPKQINKEVYVENI